MSIQKAAAISVCAALIALQFKGGKTEYGIYVSIAAGILLGTGIIGKLSTVLDTVKEIGSFLQIEGSYLGVLLKMLGITYVAEFASNICKDSGCQTIAAQIQLFGKITVLALGMPVLLTLLRTIEAFLS
ncbi:stage III sporulation protein AD [Drancourtella massiliensis]|uniref:Stage III sporulation protein AD n=1 Tax=Drancourtella massiliensis TaxID=1632013 RepID=A0ABS2ED16_9FIRM|nr:SpoIIIAC/SpoIIIAD family protein [Drancourtella massiliensis]MBM6742817.1 stage III sporulation protein AD [Drancourtella massiliensis]